MTADEVFAYMDRAIAGIDNDVNGFICFKCYPVKGGAMRKGLFCFHTVIIQLHFVRVWGKMFVVIIVGNDRI